MESTWFDKEANRLEEALDNGEISNEEFRKEMRSLRDELQEQAEEAAEQAYYDITGGW